MCRFRHPRICKFYKQYRRCKFDPCAFLHVNTENNLENLVNDNNAINEKLKEVEESLNELNTKEYETLNIIEKLKNVETKLDHFHDVGKELSARDTIIEGQQTKITELEKRLVKVEKILEKLKALQEKTKQAGAELCQAQVKLG
jgi:DNA repair exonuclease SbcCD ATPase subunit